MQPLLITGPPGSGKTTEILRRYRQRAERAWILTPTTTMAEHLAHELARQGLLVRPSRVTTLARFADTLSEPLRTPSAARLQTLVERALQDLSPPPFAGVLRYPGFATAAAALLEELASGGSPARRLRTIQSARAQALAEVFARVEQALRRDGFALRYERLARAADRLRRNDSRNEGIYLLDGFFEFVSPELDLLEAMAACGEVAVTLPDGVQANRAWFSRKDFQERRCGVENRRRPRVRQFRSPTLGMEANEIARRVRQAMERGRAPREIGVVVRSRDPYVPLLETAFTRFGIPYRSYFADPVERHPAVRFLAGLVDAAQAQWDWEVLLPLLAMPAGPLARHPEADRVDFELRSKLPGSGLDPLRQLAPEALDRIEKTFSSGKAMPTDWAERLSGLVDLLPAPRDREHWRAVQPGVEAFLDAIEEARALLAADTPVTLEGFWQEASRALRLAQLWPRDRRREVVHILDVYEARQWELAVVFVCGLNERLFPQYHWQDALLGDAARRTLGLKTSADRDAEERFLFELATTRATSELVLSHAQFNEKGDVQLPSFFLQPGEVEDAARRVRPAPALAPPGEQAVALDDPELRERLRVKHRKLSPSAIDSYLQCPFQFFVRQTLGLAARPVRPEERLDVLTQGSIMHRALEFADQPLRMESEFHAAFERFCEELNVPDTYRREAIRREMLRNLSACAAIRGLGWKAETEVRFEFDLNDSLSIKGRIDRLESSSRGEALVIDFKYSAPSAVKSRAGSDATVQTGLYLIAAERALKKKPFGMLYCGVKSGITWVGCHLEDPDLREINETVTPDELRRRMEIAAETAARAQQTILLGRILPQPADVAKCAWCEARDICRVSAAAPEQVGVADAAPDGGEIE